MRNFYISSGANDEHGQANHERGQDEIHDHIGFQYCWLSKLMTSIRDDTLGEQRHDLNVAQT